MSWLSRLANVFRTSKVERDLDDELRFHIESPLAALSTPMGADSAYARCARRAW